MALRIFEAPKYVEEVKRQAELPFSGNVAAGAELTLLAGPISYRFRVIAVKMIFTADANNWIRHYWLVDRSRTVSTSGLPSGTNIFARESPVSYFTGKAVIRVVPTNISFDEEMLYVKLHTHNTGPYAYDISASIIIQEV